MVKHAQTIRRLLPTNFLSVSPFCVVGAERVKPSPNALHVEPFTTRFKEGVCTESIKS